MAKKRQEDFQKKRLRLLPKGKNITKTEFKSKKIILKHQKSLDRSVNLDNSNCEDFLSSISHANDATRHEALSNLKSQIIKNETTFVIHLPEIFNQILKFITHSDDKTRNAAVSTLKAVLSMTSDLQVESYFPLLTSTVNCAMTHSEFNVRHQALDILNTMLDSHPDLICQSITVLDNLLDMISLKSMTSNQKGGTRKRVLETVLNNNISAQDWRIMVFQTLDNFLKAMLKSMDRKRDIVDEQEVIFSISKQPLCLTLYAGGGLKPVKLQNTKHWYLNSESNDNHCSNPEVYRKYVDELHPLIESVLIEELSEYSLRNKCQVSLNTVEHLYVLVEVYCQLGEWLNLLMTERVNDLGMWFTDIMYNSFLSRILRGFPYCCQEEKEGESHKNRKNIPLSSVDVNLAICLLYSAFLLKPDSGHRPRISVIKYFDSLYKTPEACDSIPMLIKITKNYLKSTDSDLINANLACLCQLLEMPTNNRDHKLLQSFFLELSLHPDYNHLALISDMKSWFQQLLQEVSEMVLSKSVDKGRLNDIKRICCRKYDLFRDCCNEMSESIFIDLLKYDNEDMQETVVYLICQKSSIPGNILRGIAGLIHDNYLKSTRSVIRIIRSLTCRFLKATASEKSSYFFFLLNVACDTYALGNNAQEYAIDEIAEYQTEWEGIQPSHYYCIYPSMIWKFHAELYEVCTESLLNIYGERKVSLNVTKFVKTFLTTRCHFPVHCLIALCKLKNSYAFVDAELTILERNLMYNVMLYASAFSMYAPNEEMFTFSISELFNTLNLNRKKACYLLQQIENGIKDSSGSPKVLFHYLRIFKFLIVQKFLSIEDAMIILPQLERIKEICNPRDLQPLWIQICTFFGYYY